MAQENAGYQVDRSTALYERPKMAVADAETFEAVKGEIESKFAAGNVEKFLKSLERLRSPHSRVRSCGKRR